MSKDDKMPIETKQANTIMYTLITPLVCKLKPPILNDTFLYNCDFWTHTQIFE